MPSAMIGRKTETMTEFLTWNASNRGVPMTGTQSAIMSVMTVLFLAFIVYFVAWVMNGITSDYDFLGKDYIASEADMIDALEYMKVNMPSGMECHYMAVEEAPPLVRECVRENGCIHCPFCVLSELSEIEKDNMFVRQYDELMRKDGCYIEVSGMMEGGETE